MQIPEKPKESERAILKEWMNNYGDLNSLYRVHYKKSDMGDSFEYRGGWTLNVLKNDWNGIYITCVFPYAVGYKRNGFFGDNYMPSVADAVNSAFEFYTTNDKSIYYDDFDNGCIRRIWLEIKDAANEYYSVEDDGYQRAKLLGISLFEEDTEEGKMHAIQNGYMENGLYKVFIASSQPKTWTIKKKSWGPDEEDKINLWTFWSTALTIVFLLAELPIVIIEIKRRKEKRESLYVKLKRLCDPSNFVNDRNYSKEKVDKANAIDKLLIGTAPDDIDALNKLKMLAASELGVCIIDVEKLMELKAKVNPKNFMSPYNPEKVALANELFAILNKKGLTENDMIEVEERAKSL